MAAHSKLQIASMKAVLKIAKQGSNNNNQGLHSLTTLTKLKQGFRRHVNSNPRTQLSLQLNTTTGLQPSTKIKGV